VKTYNVTIRATITKTHKVEADSEEDAVNLAHEIFSVLNDDIDENYDQQMHSVEEVKTSDEAVMPDAPKEQVAL
jgi:hypothetical protein